MDSLQEVIQHVSWDSSGSYKNEGKLLSFLFSLKNPSDSKPQKFNLHKPENSIYCHSSYRSIFGGGHDLLISNGCNGNNSSSTKFGTAYTNTTEQDGQTFLFGATNFTVNEIEVFSVFIAYGGSLKESTIASPYINDITTFFGKLPKFTLLFRASIHGFQAQYFHAFCELKGPAITFIRSSDGYICGGCTPFSWDVSSSYRQDPQKQSFLFTLKDPSGTSTQKFSLSNNNNSIYCHSIHNPIFGSGHDIDLCETVIKQKVLILILGIHIPNQMEMVKHFSLEIIILLLMNLKFMQLNIHWKIVSLPHLMLHRLQHFLTPLPLSI
jgi:hypothetical protein